MSQNASEYEEHAKRNAEMSSRAATAASALSEALVGMSTGVSQLVVALSDKGADTKDLNNLSLMLAVGAEDAAKLAMFLSASTDAWAVHAEAWAEQEEDNP